MLEKFFQAHQYTTDAIGHFATVAAVIVSLALAFMQRRANKTRLTAYAAMSTILHDTIDANNRPRYLTVSIRNKGLMPLRVPFSFFHWRAPFKRGTFIVNPHDGYGLDEWVAQKRYPVEIAPRASETFFVSSAKALHEELPRAMTGEGAISPWQFRHMRAVVVTDDGMIFKVKVSDDVRRELDQLSREHGSEEQ